VIGDFGYIQWNGYAGLVGLTLCISQLGSIADQSQLGFIVIHFSLIFVVVLRPA
jgi:hypothetical protein